MIKFKFVIYSRKMDSIAAKKYCESCNLRQKFLKYITLKLKLFLSILCICYFWIIAPEVETKGLIPCYFPGLECGAFHGQVLKVYAVFQPRGVDTLERNSNIAYFAHKFEIGA